MLLRLGVLQQVCRKQWLQCLQAPASDVQVPDAYYAFVCCGVVTTPQHTLLQATPQQRHCHTQKSNKSIPRALKWCRMLESHLAISDNKARNNLPYKCNSVNGHRRLIRAHTNRTSRHNNLNMLQQQRSMHFQPWAGCLAPHPMRRCMMHYSDTWVVPVTLPYCRQSEITAPHVLKV